MMKLYFFSLLACLPLFSQNLPNYDVTAEVTLQGTIEAWLFDGSGQARLVTNEGVTLTAFYASRRFLIQEGILDILTSGAEVTLTGVFDPTTAERLVVRTAVVDGMTLTFRDELGVPVWRNQGKRQNAAGKKGGRAGSSGSGTACQYQYLASLPLGTLTESEIADIQWMREEEKLARDVYLTFAEQFGLAIFTHIAQSEQQHMDTVAVLMDRYGLADSLVANEIGVFGNPVLADLYAQLIAAGTDVAAALTIGATIEDLDIVDLQDALSHSDNTDVRFVWQNLMKGSRNHLRSFVGQLTLQGLTYDATYLPAEEVAAIVNAPMERGAVDADGLPLDGCRPSGSGQGGNGGSGGGRGR
jgi:hypothetical protein